MVKLAALILTIVYVVMTADTALASGAAAKRSRPAIRPHVTPAVHNTASGTSGRPTIQGPPVNLGPRQHSVYAHPRQKSINVPTLPNEHQEEKAPEPAEAKPMPQVQKKVEQYYPSSRVLTSSGSNSTLARASLPSQNRVSHPSSGAAATAPEAAVLFDRFDRSSEPWLNISDARIKDVIVTHYVDLYKQFGIDIRKPAVYYVNLVDAMAKNNPRLLTQPFDQVLRIVSILEYDYNSGEDKDTLAASILPDKRAFLQNRQRLGIR